MVCSRGKGEDIRGQGIELNVVEVIFEGWHSLGPSGTDSGFDRRCGAAVSELAALQGGGSEAMGASAVADLAIVIKKFLT